MDEKRFMPSTRSLVKKGSSSSTNNGSLQPSTRKARDLAASNSVNAAVLCLECRQTGHIVNKCPFPWPSEKPGWFSPPDRKALDFGTPSSAPHERLCESCHDLELILR